MALVGLVSAEQAAAAAEAVAEAAEAVHDGAREEKAISYFRVEEVQGGRPAPLRGKKKK